MAIHYRVEHNPLTKPAARDRYPHRQRDHALCDMRDGGTEGLPVPVTGNGDYTLPGFSGSAVSSLEIRVDDYAALKTMVLNDYDGSLVDILDVRMA